MSAEIRADCTSSSLQAQSASTADFADSQDFGSGANLRNLSDLPFNSESATASGRPGILYLAFFVLLAVSPLSAQSPTVDTNYRTYFQRKLSVDAGEQVSIQKACCLIGPIQVTNLEWSPWRGGITVREWTFYDAAGYAGLAHKALWRHVGGIAGNYGGRGLFSAGWIAAAAGVGGIVCELVRAPIRIGYLYSGGLILGGAALVAAGHFIEKSADKLLATNTVTRDEAKHIAGEYNRSQRNLLRIQGQGEQ